MKKNKGKIANNNKERVGTFRRKKKKPSHIKKMKEIYELIKNGEGANLKNVVVINPQLNHFPPPHYNNPNMMR
jgi:hypothetical protein